MKILTSKSIGRLDCITQHKTVLWAYSRTITFRQCGYMHEFVRLRSPVGKQGLYENEALRGEYR